MSTPRGRADASIVPRGSHAVERLNHENSVCRGDPLGVEADAACLCVRKGSAKDGIPALLFMVTPRYRKNGERKSGSDGATMMKRTYFSDIPVRSDMYSS